MRTVKYDGKIFAAPCGCDKRPKQPREESMWGQLVHRGYCANKRLNKKLPEQCQNCGFYPWIVLPKERK